MKANSLNLLRRLVCVPTCAACKCKLSPFVDENELNHGIPCMCADCLKKWQTACIQMCHNCSRVASACTCMPVKKTFTQPSIPSLFFYHPDTSRAESKVIYTLKHKNDRDLFDFVALELYSKLEAMLGELDINGKDCIFTYIPRTRRALVKNGFDQGEMLCKRIASLAGAQTLPLLSRKITSREQKRLSKGERSKNAERSIFANTSLKGIGRDNGSSIEEITGGKTIIVVEDIITTGATIKRAVTCLRDKGAECVLVCAAARSEIATDKNRPNDK